MADGAPDRLRFGVFMAPFHPAGESPTLLLDGDAALVTRRSCRPRAADRGKPPAQITQPGRSFFGSGA